MRKITYLQRRELLCEIIYLTLRSEKPQDLMELYLDTKDISIDTNAHYSNYLSKYLCTSPIAYITVAIAERLADACIRGNKKLIPLIEFMFEEYIKDTDSEEDDSNKDFSLSHSAGRQIVKALLYDTDNKYLSMFAETISTKLLNRISEDSNDSGFIWPYKRSGHKLDSKYIKLVENTSTYAKSIDYEEKANIFGMAAYLYLVQKSFELDDEDLDDDSLDEFIDDVPKYMIYIATRFYMLYKDYGFGDLLEPHEYKYSKYFKSEELELAQKEINDKDKEIEQYRQELEKQRVEISNLRSMLTELTDIKDKYNNLKVNTQNIENNNSKVLKLEDEVKELQNERSSLYARIQSLSEQLNIEEEHRIVPLNEKIECIKEFNVVILGGRQNVLAKLRSYFPVWKMVDPDAYRTQDSKLALKCDVFVVMASCIKHQATNYFVKSDNMLYIYDDNIETIIHKIYDYLDA